MAGLGKPKTGGRVKGVKNRASQAFVDRMEELRAQGLDCDPVQVLMEIAIGRTLNGEVLPVEYAIRSRAAEALCSYSFPRLRAIEISGNEGAPIVFSVIADEQSPAERAALGIVSSTAEQF